jgi:hypothetical protein
MKRTKKTSPEEVYTEFQSLDEKDQISVFKIIKQYLEDKQTAAKKSLEALSEIVKEKN